MQETRPAGMSEAEAADLGMIRREYFQDPRAMNRRLVELERAGEVLVQRRKVGRNQKCPCGSQKKFKRCCMAKIGSTRVPVAAEAKTEANV